MGEIFFRVIAFGCLGYAVIGEVPSVQGDSILDMGTLKAWFGDCLENHQTTSAIGCISFGLGVAASGVNAYLESCQAHWEREDLKAAISANL